MLMSVALLAGVGGAFAISGIPECYYSPQFYKVDELYFPAGEKGVNYHCMMVGGTCTWYKPDPILQPNTYVHCTEGYYFKIF